VVERRRLVVVDDGERLAGLQFGKLVVYPVVSLSLGGICLTSSSVIVRVSVSEGMGRVANMFGSAGRIGANRR